MADIGDTGMPNEGRVGDEGVMRRGRPGGEEGGKEREESESVEEGKRKNRFGSGGRLIGA